MEDREFVHMRASALTVGAGSRIMGGLILLVLCTGSAAAKCQDAPGPGADWSGCSKARLVLADPVQDAAEGVGPRGELLDQRSCIHGDTSGAWHFSSTFEDTGGKVPGTAIPRHFSA